jgi:hypothetical protein
MASESRIGNLLSTSLLISNLTVAEVVYSVDR